MSILYKTIKRIAEETGYSEYAIRTKIRDGIWPEGQVWIKAPDDRILISVDGYNKWVEKQLGYGRKAKQALKSRSNTKVKDSVRSSNLSPLPLI